MNTPALQKTYQGRTVLALPPLCLTPGRVLAVIGANGCGKSSFLRLLAGVIPGDAGRVTMPVRVGYMPQKSYAFALSVKSNLLTVARDVPRADALLAALGLTALSRNAAHRLSGGETAKMALARVLMRDCELLLLDEPTAAMDTAATLAAETLLRAYAERTRAAVVLVTHSPAQAARVADETAFLETGRLVERADTHTLLTAAQDPRTRQFLAFCGYAGG